MHNDNSTEKRADFYRRIRQQHLTPLWEALHSPVPAQPAGGCQAALWRYRELLPVAKAPTVGLEVGFTPLIKADRLAKRLGIRELWIKNDAVNYPTLSFKDRVVSVALSRARELGYETVACASTGNLANSVAANAAASGMKAFVFIPHDLEKGKALANEIALLRIYTASC